MSIKRILHPVAVLAARLRSRERAAGLPGADGSAAARLWRASRAQAAREYEHMPLYGPGL